jgi:hypothetical protein
VTAVNPTCSSLISSFSESERTSAAQINRMPTKKIALPCPFAAAISAPARFAVRRGSQQIPPNCSHRLHATSISSERQGRGICRARPPGRCDSGRRPALGRVSVGGAVLSGVLWGRDSAAGPPPGRRPGQFRQPAGPRRASIVAFRPVPTAPTRAHRPNFQPSNRATASPHSQGRPNDDSNCTAAATRNCDSNRHGHRSSSAVGIRRSSSAVGTPQQQCSREQQCSRDQAQPARMVSGPGGSASSQPGLAESSSREARPRDSARFDQARSQPTKLGPVYRRHIP